MQQQEKHYIMHHLKMLKQEVGQKIRRQIYIYSNLNHQQELNSGRFQSRSAETKPHQSLPFITMSSATPTAYAFSAHQPQDNNGAALNMKLNLIRNAF